jgi:hypothetical protein
MRVGAKHRQRCGCEAAKTIGPRLDGVHDISLQPRLHRTVAVNARGATGSRARQFFVFADAEA